MFFSNTYSVIQNINQLCLGDHAPFKDEYDILFRSLFSSTQNHIEIIEALVAKKDGMTRNEIIKTTSLKNGGGLTRILEELEESNFIRKYRKFGQVVRGSLYQLIDNYTLFYNRFIKAKGNETDFWINTIHSPQYYNWAGNAFEIVCFQHISEIKKALGISGIYTEISSWQNNKAQIDLVIDRRDRIINLVEVKYSIQKFEISKSYAESLRNKLSQFLNDSLTKKAIWYVLVTTHGLKNNKHAGLIQATITMEDLF